MITTHHLGVPGARLFYTVSGSGPLLLIAQGGAQDADGARLLAEELPDFTVVSWDRRGLSRSTVEPSETPLTLSVHADDARRILDAVSPGTPAYVFGSSIGALVGLDLLTRSPEHVRRLVAHEPPIAALLDPARTAELVGMEDKLAAAYRAGGALAAMREFIASFGVDPSDHEPHVSAPARSPSQLVNFERFLSVDGPAVRRYRLDLAAIRAHAATLVVAVGASSRATLHAAPALALASMLGTEAVELPGGHGGYGTHPRAFAAALRAVLR
jgi:pimeloyl-ACP methyl ester carboxylesterase